MCLCKGLGTKPPRVASKRERKRPRNRPAHRSRHASGLGAASCRTDSFGLRQPVHASRLMRLLPVLAAGAAANVDWESSSPVAARGLLGDDPVVVPAPSAAPTVDAPACSCKHSWSNSHCSNQEGCPPTTCDSWHTNWCEVEPAGCDGSISDGGGMYWMECDQSTPVGSSAPTVSPDLGDGAPKAQFLAPAA